MFRRSSMCLGVMLVLSTGSPSFAQKEGPGIQRYIYGCINVVRQARAHRHDACRAPKSQKCADATKALADVCRRCACEPEPS